MKTYSPDDLAIQSERDVRVPGCARRAWVAALALVPVFAFAQGMQIPKPTPGLFPNPAAGKKLFAADCVQLLPLVIACISVKVSKMRPLLRVK